jgi:ATP-binding cassette subfamily G (WHITE) protein 2 (SNQ2)
LLIKWTIRTSFIIISSALIVSSLFTGQALDTVGAFSRGGTLLFSVVFLAWMQLAELSKAVSGRTVISRHKNYAFYRPAVASLARVIIDLPFILIQVTIFSIIVYFLGDLDREASKSVHYFTQFNSRST